MHFQCTNRSDTFVFYIKNAPNLKLILYNSSDSAKISSKLEFGDDSKSSEYELIDEVRKPIKRSEESKEMIEEDEESVKFIKSDGKSEKLTDKDLVCNSNKCVVEIENGSNKRKTSTDIHVKISTKTEDDSDENQKKPKIDVPEVPVIKGYAGVNPEDVKKDTEDNGVGINIPMDNPNIVYSRDSDSEMPSINLRPPKFYPNNWHNLEPKTTEKPSNYHPYLIGDQQNHIPQGWVSSGWKPMIPSFSNPDDYYHYNVNNNEKGFSDNMPHYFNYCTCTRKPVFQQRPSYSPHHRSSGYPRRGHPWFHHETTPKTVIDDKLDGPFSKTKSRRYSKK